MTIGIVTIHFPYNYGAMLQAYALKAFLNEHGADAQIIDYRPYFIDKAYHFYFKSIIKDPRIFISRILRVLFPSRRICRKSFEEFLQNAILDNKSSGLNEAEYDILIAGSDQIWNPHITNDDINYLLSFEKEGKSVKISYASSIAIKNVDNDWINKMKLYLSDFKNISVREANAVDILSELLRKKISVVADPTFLIEPDVWRKIARKPEKFSGKNYALVYKLEDNSSLDNRIIEYRKKTGISVLSIHPFRSRDQLADISLNNIGPQEFLWLIDNAQQVFTNSFHGLAFSIIFKKQIAVCLHTQTGSRMEQLINELDMKSDEAGVFDASEIDEKIRYQFIDHSKKWLLNAIND